MMGIPHEEYKKNSARQRAESTNHLIRMLVAGLVVLAVISLSLYTSGRHVAFTTDSLLYRDIGQHLLSGEYRYVSNVATETPASVSLVKWPPLYPAVWAIAAALSADGLDGAIFGLQLTLLALTTLMLFWAGLVVTGSVPTAAVLTLLNACLPSTQLIFAYAWSETLFMPLTIAAFALLYRYLDRYVDRPRAAWMLVASAVLIGLANWTRHSGMVFVPILGLSVLAFADCPLRQRIRLAVVAIAVSTLVAAPLWIQNWYQSDSLFGGSRGGPPDPMRTLDDIRLFADLMSKSLFAFDTVIEAFLRLPLLVILAVSLVLAMIRHGTGLIRDKSFLLPAGWALGCLLSLLGARLAQKHVDFDLRMLAIMAPFAFLAMGPFILASFRSRHVAGLRAVIMLFCGLIVYSGLSLAGQIHSEHVGNRDATWPSTFTTHFQDMSRDSDLSRRVRIALENTPRDVIVLTDQPGRYLRYLGWKRAYVVSTADSCLAWVRRYEMGMVFIMNPDNLDRALKCVSEMPGWHVAVMK